MGVPKGLNRSLTVQLLLDSRGEDYGEGKAATKPKLQTVGDWSEYKSSSGKIYYYNSSTEVSQWEKPTEWAEQEKYAELSVLSPPPKIDFSSLFEEAVE